MANGLYEQGQSSILGPSRGKRRGGKTEPAKVLQEKVLTGYKTYVLGRYNGPKSQTPV